MIRRQILINYIKRHTAAIGLSLSVGLLLSCASSYQASNGSSDETQSDATPSKKGASIEDELGSNHRVAGDSHVSEIEYTDSSVDRNDWAEADQADFVAVDKWDDSYAYDGIDATDPEQIPIGLWVGETEKEFACTTSRRVVIEIATAPESNRAFGVVVFGEGEPPTPAQDPDIGYLSEDDSFGEQCHDGFPTEGFPYTILEGYVNDNSRFHFRIGVVEVYQSWCTLQTSYYSEYDATQYRCLPNLNREEERACQDENAECPVDYHKFRLCGMFGPCICSQDGCVANMNRTLRFDFIIEDSQIEGIVTNLTLDSTTTEVRLRKVR
jgi:hypothetical protein